MERGSIVQHIDRISDDLYNWPAELRRDFRATFPPGRRRGVSIERAWRRSEHESPTAEPEHRRSRRRGMSNNDPPSATGGDPTLVGVALRDRPRVEECRSDEDLLERREPPNAVQGASNESIACTVIRP